MDRLLFILNPIAGGGRAKDLQELIEKKMKEVSRDYEIILTEKPKDATRIAENSNHNTIIAVGGDGTVNEVAKGLINRGHGLLGIVPGGTGNDLSRILGISNDPLEAIDTILRRKTKEIDIGCANEHKFLNIGSIGFDAEVVINTDKFKNKVKGKFAYVLSVLFTLLTFRKKTISLEIDGKKFNSKLVLLAIGNGRYYGGGMMILPQAKLDDKYLHLCLIRKANNFTLLALFPTIFKGTHISFKRYVQTFKAREVIIKSDKDMYFNIDGEIHSGGKEIKFNLCKERLSVIYE